MTVEFDIKSPYRDRLRDLLDIIWNETDINFDRGINIDQFVDEIRDEAETAEKELDDIDLEDIDSIERGVDDAGYRIDKIQGLLDQLERRVRDLKDELESVKEVREHANEEMDKLESEGIA